MPYFLDKFSLPIIFTAFLLMVFGAVMFVVLSLYRGTDHTRGSVTVGAVEFEVDVADTAALRSQGLSGRESLAQNEGMWFIFPSEGRYSFWMKGMRFPIDIIWVAENRVVDIHENVPPPTGMTNFKTYTPATPADRVLEVPAGTVAREDIQIGDEVRFEPAKK